MLAEGSYFQGAAALCNSLARHGFAGGVLIGYRGMPPAWAMTLPGTNDAMQSLSPDIRIRFVKIESEWHMTNLKARFLQRIVQEFPEFRTLYYFDVDIVITCAWQNFLRWAKHGVVMCLDVSDTYMPVNHVFRREWQALAQRAGFAIRPVTGYFNAGCIGFSPAHVGLLDVWARLIDELAADGMDMTRMVAPGGRPEFAKMDQDVLNAALMASDIPIALLGKEAMGTFPNASVMEHAMMFKKPWNRNYLLDALKGFPPDTMDLAFWENVETPIAIFSPTHLRWKRLQIRLARWIGLLRRRSLRAW